MKILEFFNLWLYRIYVYYIKIRIGPENIAVNLHHGHRASIEIIINNSHLWLSNLLVAETPMKYGIMI